MSRVSEGLRKAAQITDQLVEAGRENVPFRSCSIEPMPKPPFESEKDRVSRGFSSDSPLHICERGPSGFGQQAQEQIANLVQRVFVFPNSAAPRVVVFSSIDEGGASNEICFRSGAALAAQVSGSVCLIDANFRGPLLVPLSGLEKLLGLADAMINADPIRDFAVQVAPGNLWLVPAGSRLTDEPSLFASERWCARLLELREEFDYVLIDAPPVGSCADTVLLGQSSDGVILVVEANSTRRETALKAKQTFESAQVKLLGAVLNNRTFPIPEVLYRKL